MSLWTLPSDIWRESLFFLGPLCVNMLVSNMHVCMHTCIFTSICPSIYSSMHLVSRWWWWWWWNILQPKYELWHFGHCFMIGCQECSLVRYVLLLCVFKRYVLRCLCLTRRHNVGHLKLRHVWGTLCVLTVCVLRIVFKRDTFHDKTCLAGKVSCNKQSMNQQINEDADYPFARELG